MRIYFYGHFTVLTMECDPFSKGDSLGNCYMFYSAPALLNHDRVREFGIVIAEAKNNLIIVDDEIIREHVYSIPKTKVDYYSDKQLYFNVPERSLKDFEI
jgi:hypothetical protein